MRLGAPRRTLPAVVPAERLTARTDEVTVSLSHLMVYPAGFEFEVFVDALDDLSELNPFQISHRPRGQDMDPLAPEQLLLGFEFADGAKATNVRMGGNPGTTSPVLIGGGSSRDGGYAHQSFWLCPLPPPGPLEFVCEWPAARIPLTRTELDSAAIIEASSRAQTMFADSREALD